MTMEIKITIFITLGTLLVIWFVITEGNLFLREDNDDCDPTHQSID